MKQSIIIVSVLLAFLGYAKAQDTVTYGSGRYLFNPRNMNNLRAEPQQMHLKYRLMLPYFPSAGQRIYGIAMTIEDETFASYQGGTIGLYVLRNGLPVLVDTVTMDSASARCYFKYEGQSWGYHSYIAPCYELVFKNCEKEELIMSGSDTILLAIVDSTQFAVPPTNPAAPTHYYLPLYCAFDGYGTQPYYDRQNNFFGALDPNDPQSWEDNTMGVGFWGGLFPMLEPDHPHCPAIKAPSVVEQGDDWVTLSWNSTECDSFELVISTPLDTTITLADTSYTLTGLPSGYYYYAYLQSLCHHVCCAHDTVVRGARSALVYFLVNTGINDADDGVPSITLQPNPAYDIVEMTAATGITLVEAFSENGALAYRTAADGHSTVHIDVSGWSTGSYLLRIHTSEGVASRKLVVRH